MNPNPSTSSLYKTGSFRFDRFQTLNPAMAECLRLANAAAGSDLAVLINGETGTGKNLLAQAIHNASARRDKPFVVVNCTALSETLIESELFGHEKGAFTGADAMRKGRFEMADGGTLVLDEIGDMSPAAQAKILRAVEYKQLERLGGQSTILVDVRVIAMTHQPLPELVAQKTFREDLLYRLREFHLEVPALRDRPEDITMLASILLNQCLAKSQKDIRGFSDDAKRLMAGYPWPGNLRELKSAIRRAELLCEGPLIEAHDLGLAPLPSPGGTAPGDAPSGLPEELTLKAAEKAQIERVLAQTKGNKRQASKLLEIARNTLDKKIDDYGIDVQSFSVETI